MSSRREALLKLMDDKDQLEKKISDCGAVLEANADVGMHGPLIDADGFPRNDIDIYQVRKARQQIICLQNDHKSLMKEIEKLMHALHSCEKTSSDEQIRNQRHEQIDNLAVVVNDININKANKIISKTANQSEVSLKVIVEVNLVSPDSPAEKAGLRVGDRILEFGTINSNNFIDLKQIGDVVNQMRDRDINLKVLRQEETLELMLKPMTWSGRGLLGCNIILPKA